MNVCLLVEEIGLENVTSLDWKIWALLVLFSFFLQALADSSTKACM